MTIGIDIDDVIINTTEEVLNEHHRRTGEWLSLSDIKSYEMNKYVSPEYSDSIWWCFADIWDKVKPLKDCIEVINNLRKYHNIIFVTATKSEINLQHKMKLLQQWFGDVDIISTMNKQSVKMDLLIDDYQKNLINAKYIGLLFDYEWNKNFDESSQHIFRVHNWEEIWEYVGFIDAYYNELW